MERKILSEELGRMSYLFGYKRGVVVSEQDGQLVGSSNDKKKSGVDVSVQAPDWDGQSSGQISVTNLSKDNTGTNVNAINVPYNNNLYSLLISKGIGKNLPYTYEETAEIVTPPTYSDFEFIGKTFPFQDNMIRTDTLKNVEAENLLNLVRDTVINNIKKGGLSSIKSIKIKGFADSARPTDKGPGGVSLDHGSALDENLKKLECSKIYCGEKDNDKRNQFLALQRARNMAKDLRSRISGELTIVTKNETQNKFVDDIRKNGIPSSLFVIDYYADPVTNSVERTGKRSVTIEIIPAESKTEPGSIDTEKKYITVVPIPKKGTLDYDGVKISVSEIISKAGHSSYKVVNDQTFKDLVKSGKIPDFSVTGQLNGKTIVDGSIENNSITIDNLVWGNIVEYGSSKSGLESGSFAKLKWVTEQSVLCVVSITETEAELLNYRVVLAEPQ